MKIFKNLQQLWSYALFCPICKDICRDIAVNCGPEEIWKSFRSLKKDHILTISGEIQIKKDIYVVEIPINCLENSFEFFATGNYPAQDIIDRAGCSYLFFHLESNCRKCLGSWVISNDLELNLLNRMVDDIGLEVEEIWIPGKYKIYYQYFLNNMEIDKIELNPDEDGEYESAIGNPIKLPIFEFDFKDLEKTVNKIKTLITFS